MKEIFSAFCWRMRGVAAALGWFYGGSMGACRFSRNQAIPDLWRMRCAWMTFGRRMGVVQKGVLPTKGLPSLWEGMAPMSSCPSIPHLTFHDHLSLATYRVVVERFPLQINLNPGVCAL